MDRSVAFSSQHLGLVTLALRQQALVNGLALSRTHSVMLPARPMTPVKRVTSLVPTSSTGIGVKPSSRHAPPPVTRSGARAKIASSHRGATSGRPHGYGSFDSR